MQDFIESADSGVTVETEQLFGLGGTVGRYVKFTGHGNSSSTSWTSIANVNIYGDVNCENAVSNIAPMIEKAIIEIYPVPTLNKNFTVTSSEVMERLYIYNSVGQLVLESQANGSKMKSLDVSNLDSGIYFLNIDGKEIKKLVVD